MGQTTQQLSNAIDRFDAANANDPKGTALLYAQRMTQWLGRLYPDASEALQLAARAQHLRRWEIPRSSYPMDRTGYLRWRTRLYDFHADAAADILRDVGYEQPLIDRVRSLLKKQRLKADAEAQALEDVVCLVFLQFEFGDFFPKHEETKIVNILRRTWAKMSPHGREAAAELQLPPLAKRLMELALNPPKESQ